MMSPVMRARAIFACCSLFSAPLMHAALAHGRFLPLALAAAAAQAGFGAWLAAGRRGLDRRGLDGWRVGRWRLGRWPMGRLIIAAAAVLAVLTAGAWLTGIGAAPLSLTALSGLNHAGLFAVLLMLFAGSLRPGRTPAATLIARAARGPLPPELLRYTRQVTWVWAGYAALQLLLSALLLAFGPAHIWSLFVNALDLPLTLLLFAGEYAWRRFRFRDLPRLSTEQLRRAINASVLARRGS